MVSLLVFPKLWQFPYPFRFCNPVRIYGRKINDNDNNDNDIKSTNIKVQAGHLQNKYTLQAKDSENIYMLSLYCLISFKYRSHTKCCIPSLSAPRYKAVAIQLHQPHTCLFHVCSLSVVLNIPEQHLEITYFPAHKTHFFPEKCDLNLTCAEGKYYFQTYKYPYSYYTTSLSCDSEICFQIMRSGVTARERLTFL
jgi:hypothetical protein